MPPPGTLQADPQGPRINLVTAVRRTLEHELAVNPRMLVFGEDVGRKGRRARGDARACRRNSASGASSIPVSRRKASSAGRSAWRPPGSCPCPRSNFANTRILPPSSSMTAAPCAGAPSIDSPRPWWCEFPAGFFKCGDPWHSQSNEVQWLHGLGWRVAMPSNAQDAVGLLRSALRGNDPTIFFEHRSLLDGACARRAYPGDEFVVPFGKASVLREGTTLTRGQLGRHGRALRAEPSSSTGVSADHSRSADRSRPGIATQRWPRCARPAAA